MGWSNVAGAVLQATTVIVSGSGSNTGVFIYSGAPANGNLIGSWTGASGTDPYGNAFPQGLNVSIGTISGTSITGGSVTGSNLVVQGSNGSLLLYSGTPATGNLIGSWAANAGTDAFGNSFVAGLALYNGSEKPVIELLYNDPIITTPSFVAANGTAAPNDVALRIANSIVEWTGTNFGTGFQPNMSVQVTSSPTQTAVNLHSPAPNSGSPHQSVLSLISSDPANNQSPAALTVVQGYNSALGRVLQTDLLPPFNSATDNPFQIHFVSVNGTTDVNGAITANHGATFTPKGGVITGNFPGGTFANLTSGIDSSAFTSTTFRTTWKIGNTGAAYASSAITFYGLLWG